MSIIALIIISVVVLSGALSAAFVPALAPQPSP